MLKWPVKQHTGSQGFRSQKRNDLDGRGKRHQFAADSNRTGLWWFMARCCFSQRAVPPPPWHWVITQSVSNIPVRDQSGTFSVCGSLLDFHVRSFTRIDISLLICLCSFLASFSTWTDRPVVFSRFYCDVTKMDVTLSSVGRWIVEVLMKPLAQSEREESVAKLPLFCHH